MRIIAWLLTIIFLSSTGIAQSNSLKLEVTLKHMETEAAYKELTAMFPKVPVGFPEGGNNEESTYKHILVCYLEYQAIKELLGELRTKQIMEFWSTDHYTWIYKTVVEREREIGSLLRKHKLLPVSRG